ncbi:hypothetical protein BU26DRAFT_48625 [Trematosphaeria pertusa]|uniref:Rhodopsin domain-containing protein n=1 Tax=Trematosphaeria pertusa TaxID=390896 RepID=A0A6A6I854_9PLEO|nr:uncharacterized protein BU26DRAFT_48625 [Trematosphaeria pertusa]KAF2246551.1 hypothetical protein BU26DRAFT_48625 [Trematosphaeria pertusa]
MVTMNHNYTKGQMIGLALGFMIPPVLFVGLRLWAKTLSAKRLAWDDYLTIAALLVSITCCALQLATAMHGHLGQHQPQYPDGSPIMDDPGLIFFEETKFAINCVSILGLGLIKSSILVLYKNIFRVRKFQLVIYGMLAFVIGWTISFFFSHLFTCFPITVFIEPYYGNKCVKTVPMFMALLFTDVIADVVILVLPIPMILSIQLPMKKKLAVIGMLGLGAAVCAVSITRVVATYAIAEEYIKHSNDVIYYTAPVFFWTNIELSLAIVCACLPTLRPIWLHFFPKPVATQSGSGYGYGSSRLAGTKNSSLGVKFGRMPYEEIEELELTRHEQLPSLPHNGVIVREVTIQQTTEQSEDSSTTSLRGKSLGA